MLDDGSTVVVDERLLRSKLLAGLPNGMRGVATEDERLYYYHLGKKGMGFTPEDRRHIWLQVTGAQGLLNASLAQKNADYNSLIREFDTEYPTCNRHQIEVDMPRTFPDEAFFSNNKQRDEREDTLQEQLG